MDAGEGVRGGGGQPSLLPFNRRGKGAKVPFS